MISLFYFSEDTFAFEIKMNDLLFEEDVTFVASW